MWLAPTRLALALAGGVARPSQGDLSQGFIVVETNYRVYAYTASALQAAILRLFCRCECVLPNLFVGVLTRDSVAGCARLRPDRGPDRGVPAHSTRTRTSPAAPRPCPR